MIKIQNATLEDLQDIHDSGGKIEGLFKIDERDYHAAPGLNSSLIKKAADSLADYRAEKYKDETKPQSYNKEAFITGSAFHKLVLEPDDFPKKYAKKPYDLDLRTTDGKKWKAENSDKDILSELEWWQIHKMADSMHKNPVFNQFQTGKFYNELSAFWIDKLTGQQMKCRFDILHMERGIADIKTSRDFVSERNVRRSIYNYHYNIQAFHYIQGALNTLPDLYCSDFVFLFVEKTDAAKTANYSLSANWLANTAETYFELLESIAHAEATMDFPGYPQTIKELTDE